MNETATSHLQKSKTKSIPIPISISTNKIEVGVYGGRFMSDYDLKQNMFDPTKCSPPNEFLIKLRMRMGKQ